MIIEKIVQAFMDLINFFTGDICIPKFSPEILEIIEEYMGYLSAGAGILANYCHLQYLAILFALLLAIDIVINLYHFIMWVIRKFPIASE